jgi:hypothetical protein
MLLTSVTFAVAVALAIRLIVPASPAAPQRCEAVLRRRPSSPER